MSELNTQEETSISHSKLIALMGVIIGIAVIALLLVYAAYLSNFSGGVSNSHTTWGEFGDFVGGTLNPLLGFLTLMALVITVVVQSNQLRISSKTLELSRRELELTRQELSKSARAQELSEVALRSQAEAANQSARLSTINYLLAQYKDEFKILSMLSYPVNDPRVESIRVLGEKIKVLTELLDSQFEKVLENGRSK